jgi:hypothetical protein
MFVSIEGGTETTTYPKYEMTLEEALLETPFYGKPEHHALKQMI